MAATSRDILRAIRAFHANARRPGEWAIVEELRFGTGFSGRYSDSRIDALAIACWPSHDPYHERIAYEVKVSRTDFKREIANPDKRVPAKRLANRFVFATPAGLIRDGELPDDCGLLEVDPDGTPRLVVKGPYWETKDPTWNMVAVALRRADDVTEAFRSQRESSAERYRQIVALQARLRTQDDALRLIGG